MLGALVGVGLTVLLPAIYQPVFDTNDDAAMMLIASGAVTGSPSADVVFMHPLVGGLLAALYGALPSMPWHGLLLYAAYAAGLGCLSRVLGAADERGASEALARGAAVSLALGAAWAVPLCRPQFTTAALLLAFSATAMLVLEPRLTFRLGGLALVACAAMIRGKAGMLGAGLAAPLILLASPPGELRVVGIAMGRAALWLGAAVVLASLVAVSRGAVMDRDPAWRTARSYQTARAGLLDSPLLLGKEDATTIKVAEAVGWSLNDVRTLKSWFTHDANVFSEERMRTFRRKGGALERTPAEAWRGLKAKLASMPVASMVATTLLLALLVALGAWRGVGAVCAAITLVVAMAMWTLLRSKLPARVLWPSVDAIALVALVASARAPQRTEQALLSRAATGLAAVIVAVVAHGWLSSASLQHSNELRRSEAATSELLARATENGWTYVPVGVALRQRYVDPLAKNEALRSLPVIRGGWLVHTPLYDRMLERHRVDDVLDALVDRDDLILVAFDFDARRVARFIEEHRGIKVRLERLPSVIPLRKLNGGFLYRLHRDVGG